MPYAAIILCALLAVAADSARAEETTAAPAITGFREVVLSVSNLRGYTKFFSRVVGWQVRARGRTDRKLLRFWNLGEKVRAKEVLMQNPGSESGFLRLVQFQGAQQQQIRPNDQSWDSGGIYDFNMRVKDLDSIADELQRLGWVGASGPSEFQFGPFTVKEWIVRGPDGVRMALIERIAPPLEGWPNLRRFSRVFNATQIVRDIDKTRSFYTDILGFKTYLEHHGASKQPGPNVLGLPHNLSTEIVRHIYILHPQAKNEGSVEILSFDGAVGADFSRRAVPPNLGMLTLRFPVADAAAHARELEKKGAIIVAGPSQVKLPGYGKCELFALRSPEGAWLEFFTEI